MIADFARHLESWYAAHGRRLPWRATDDPYRIWVSEIILQQTRVEQGLGYYNRFIERFPTVEALAFAEPDEVMRLWEGLGYYSRARNMHAAAKQIVENGSFPTTYDDVRALKGVGDYTAAAICAFAYGLPCAVVDGNVYRVLSRYFGISTPIDTTKGKREFALLAAELLDEQRSADYNQAIMDFGAIQCVPHSPECSVCPLSESCVAHAEGGVEKYPVKSKKMKPTARYFTYIIILYESKVYIRRRPTGDIWAGLYEPVLLETDASGLEETAVLSGLNIIGHVKGLKHQLTHRTIYAEAYLAEKGDTAPCSISLEGYTLVAREDLGDYAFPRLVKIVFEKLFDA